MANKKKSVKNQKKKTPQKMFPYRKRGDKKSKQNKTSKRTIQGGEMTRIEKLYNDAEKEYNIPSNAMESITKTVPSDAMESMMKNVPSDAMESMTKNVPSGMMESILKNLPSDAMESITKNVPSDMVSGLSPQGATTGTPDDPYNTALAEQKAKIDVAADTVTKELIDTLCQTINRAVYSAIHYKILGSTILTQREVNTIGKFFNINDPDEVLNQLSDNDIKIMIGSEQVPFPDDTIERIITTLFDKEESKKIIYESIPRIITELDLPQIFYKMRETDKENEQTPEEATKEIEGGDDNADNGDKDETPKADPMGDKIAQITINELPISDGLQGQNTSFDERLIDLKMDIVDKITPKIVELLNNRENDQTALERMLTSFISDDKFTDSIRDVIIAKISYLITELGTQVIYKTFTENEELVPLLKDVLKSMDAIAKLEQLKEEAIAEKNTQRATLISEVIQDLNDSLQKDVRDIVSTKITPEKNEDDEESVDEEEEESIEKNAVESVDEEEEEVKIV
jgi:hypothetical protein